MTRSLRVRLHPSLLALALLLTLVPVAQATDDGGAAAQAVRERATVSLEELLRQAFHGPGAKPVYTDHGGGAHSLAVKMPAELRERLLQAEGAGAESAILKTLATGQSLTEPTSATLFANEIVLDNDVQANHIVVGVNLGNTDTTKSTSVKNQCGSKKQTAKGNFTYDAGGILLVWFNFNSELQATGVCTKTGAIKGASPANVKTYFFMAD